MDQSALVEQIKEYLADSDHWRRLVAAIQDPDPRNAHVHSYVYTSVHPDSLEALLRGFFKRRGWPIVRRINRIRPRPGVLALHGIEPEGKVHWDFHWLYKGNVGLAPAHGVENGSNLLVWNRAYIDEFYKEFPFRHVDSDEKQELDDYFVSDHWQSGLEMVARPNVPHMHINVETSVHPEIVGQHALDSLHERGWEVHYLCPNAYMLHNQYVGKVVFMGKEPEKVYDIGWQFNPNVVIRPAETTWLFDERVGYDVMTSEQFDDEVAQNEYTRLTEYEIDAALDGIEE